MGAKKPGKRCPPTKFNAELQGPRVRTGRQRLLRLPLSPHMTDHSSAPRFSSLSSHDNLSIRYFLSQIGLTHTVSDVCAFYFVLSCSELRKCIDKARRVKGTSCRTQGSLGILASAEPASGTFIAVSDA